MPRSRLPRAVLAAICAFALSVAAAAALETREVEAVVTILERLSVETGRTVFYDERAAREWFEIDAESSRLIPAAGFGEASWKSAFDRTMTGFLAAIPQPELERMTRDFSDRLGKMTPEHRQMATAMLREQVKHIDALREQGERYRPMVAPYAARLRLLSRRN
ncbi:hypothetical protein [Bosea sp. (in: a-proteobacteria)]|uniref:hypothetical protein n=1 Tax=Bosea sp. (in: a-proteobacteria) TaxID=1871050 RepID=UPI00333E642E